MVNASLPASGATSWYAWAQAIHSALTHVPINVKDPQFGAKGDGVTDDKVAIQAALDAVPAGGGLVYFPPGDYLVSGTLQVKIEGTMIAGAGAGNRTGATQGSIGSRIKAKVGLTGSVVLVQRAADDRPLQGVHFRDITIDGSNTGTAVHGVTFRSNQGTMHNVSIWNCTGTGLIVKGYASPSWDTYDTQFTNVKVGYCGTGVELATGGADTQWVNCVFLSNSDNFVVRGSSPQVSNCHFYTAGRYDIWFDGNGSRGRFSNCKIEGASNHLVLIDSTNGGYSDIHFSGCGFSTLNQSTATNTYDYVHVMGPSGIGVGRLTFTGNSFNLKGGSTVKARYAINLSSSAVQGAVIIGNSFGPASHWGTAPLNQASSSSTLQFVRGNKGLPDLVFSNVQTAGYTVTADDCDTVLEMDAAGPVTVTIPPAAQPGLMKGNVIEIYQRGVGQVTLAPGAGVTLNTPSTLSTRARYSRIRIWMRATNSWVVEGDLG